MTSSLVDHAIWWQVYPLGACGAPVHEPDTPGEHHRLRRLEAWLDHVVELGCSGLLLGPVFASSTHGYDTLDHYRIDPRLGDDADFDHLVAQARERGLSVLLDGVFNHVGRKHHLVGTDLVRRTDDGHPWGWEGIDELVVLDHTSPAVADLVTDVMLHWLRRGIAGWRLDVAYAVPTQFWREVIGRVRREFPDALFLGEVIHGDYAAIARDSDLDSVTQYELWKGTWGALKDRNFWELAHALERHEEFSREHVMQTFVGNHDVDRIASTLGDAGAALATTILLTVPGMPSIYYGDEEAFRGVKGEGVHADDPVRPPLPESPAQLAPYGEWMYRLHQDLIGLRRRNPWLAHAHVKVLDKENTRLRYECYAAAGERLEVELYVDGDAGAGGGTWTEGAPVDSGRVQVRVDGGETWQWRSEARREDTLV